jgi:flavorubredoxin
LIQLKDGVTWVGAVDWDIRNFHGYITHRGTSYNAYIVQGEKTALVDTVKAPFYETMLRHIEEVVDPGDLDYIVANHAEPDHSGALTRIAEKAPDAKIVTSDRGIPVLRKYYGDMDLVSIKEMPQVDLGGKTLSFTPVPMAHWPDSMVSYIPEDRLLLSNDAFGQHIASTARFNDEVDQAALWQEATAYYANILMPLSRTVNNAIKALAGLDIEMIAPSHGVVWRKGVGDILAAYTRWVSGETRPRAVIAYDSMWKSTQEMAYAIAEGIGSTGVETRVFNLTGTHRSDVITEILEARAVLVGSPTLNNHVYPTVAGFLAYMRGLKPPNKIGAAFGSYGWAGGAKRFVEEQMRLAGVELVENDLDFSYKPTEEERRRCYEFGATMGEKIKS